MIAPPPKVVEVTEVIPSTPQVMIPATRWTKPPSSRVSAYGVVARPAPASVEAAQLKV